MEEKNEVASAPNTGVVTDEQKEAIVQTFPEEKQDEARGFLGL